MSWSILYIVCTYMFFQHPIYFFLSTFQQDIYYDHRSIQQDIVILPLKYEKNLFINKNNIKTYLFKKFIFIIIIHIQSSIYNNNIELTVTFTSFNVWTSLIFKKQFTFISAFLSKTNRHCAFTKTFIIGKCK